MWSESRRHARYHAEGIFGTLLPSTPVSLLNLSRSGVAIELPEPVVVGERYLFRFRHHGRSAAMEVRITWCRRKVGLWKVFRGGEVVFHAGGTIVDLYRDQGESLWATLEPESEVRR